ncbi:MAG: SDR family oxidoreductase [Syntrophomonadaceae bacterium]|nr:SDR family oxidoreductase [Syntrophomonadaceae bacterium]
MDLGIKDKLVLITASGSGIGKAIAEGFLREGCHVVINDKDELRLAGTAQDLAKLYPSAMIDYFAADLLIREKRGQLRDYIVNKYGKLDILVSNLGNGKATVENKLSVDEWERFLNINLLSTVGLLDDFAQIFKDQRYGSIILISSITAVERSGAPYGYSAAKSALLNLNKNISVDMASYGVRINCVMPGNVFFPGGRWEEIYNNDPEGTKGFIEKEVPLARFAKPEEIADAVVFLASERSSFTTGATLVVDGGQTKRY